MDMLRRVLLGKGIAYGVTPRQQPLGYIPSLSYPVCLRAGRNAGADAGFAVLAGLEIVALSCAALALALCTSGVVLALCWLLSRVSRLIAVEYMLLSKGCACVCRVCVGHGACSCTLLERCVSHGVAM
jgi:hypothetical protein